MYMWIGSCSLRALVLRACKRLTDASLQVCAYVCVCVRARARAHARLCLVFIAPYRCVSSGINKIY